MHGTWFPDLAGEPGTKHADEALLYIETDEEGQAFCKNKWVPLSYIRPIESVGLEAGAQVAELSTDVKDDAYKQGFDRTWPSWVCVWRASQLSEEAEQLNSKLYTAWLSRIENNDLKDKAMKDARGQAVLMLFNLQRHCGQTAGTQMIQECEAHTSLEYKSHRQNSQVEGKSGWSLFVPPSRGRCL